MESTNVGTNYLEQLLRYSHEYKATDLHLCVGSKPLIRVNGSLKPAESSEPLKNDIINAIVNEVLDEKRKARLEADRVIDFSFSKSGLGRFRANIYSQRGTYAIAIRMLPFEIPQLNSLGLPASIKNFTTKSKGLFLVTGATGSGKSTTLASVINHINEQNSYHIITIEDPIEYLHKHKKGLMTQREIGEDASSFAFALRAALREDPDVIMVGEMRDPETISIALTAAETGHLVLSTLHTVGAAKSIDRIIDAFPPAQQNQIRSQLATVLEGVVSQQLIPRIDKPGMVVACELMFVTPAVRNLIREGKHYQVNSTIQTGQSQGMQLMEFDLARFCNQGCISMEETVLRAQDLQLLQQFLSRRV
ncbi:MAG: type IV pilus twitching motility protein PilT [Clostridiales bacterium]|jgi:twitching motility protein PilT|nr:type IV pilus twitching motility protein PilT [Clostridiales bacterium]